MTDELSYDKYNTNAYRIYRVNNEIKLTGNHFNHTQVPAGRRPLMMSEIPQVQQYTLINRHGSFLVKKGQENIQEQRVAWADSTLFGGFTLPVIAGKTKTALKDYHSLVITYAIAKIYFPQDACGQFAGVIGNSVPMNDSSTYNLTAVIKDRSFFALAVTSSIVHTGLA